MSLRDLDMQQGQAVPKMITSQDVLSAMRMGKKTVSEIRMGMQVIPVRLLSADEVNAIRHEAKIHALKQKGDTTDENLYIQKVTLQLASVVSAQTPVPFLTDDIMKYLSVDEVGYLYGELMKFWEQMNPNIEQISPEQFRSIVDALKKNTISWNECTSPERKAIFMCFQDMIQKQDIPILPTDS